MCRRLPECDNSPCCRLGVRLTRVLCRLLPWETAPNMTHSHFDYYYEADMLGNPRIPDSVKFIVVRATAPKTFGHCHGEFPRSCVRVRDFWVMSFV